MCKECVNKLNLAYRFLKLCLESDEFLKNGTIEFVEVDDEEEPTLEDRFKLIDEMEENEDAVLIEEEQIDDFDDKSNESFDNITIEELQIEDSNISHEDNKNNVKIGTFNESFEKSLNVNTVAMKNEQNDDESESYEIEMALEQEEDTEDEDTGRGPTNIKLRRKRTVGETLLCNLCGTAFKTLKKYKTHIEEHEFKKKLRDSGQDPDHIKCELCDRTFTKIDAYIRHQKIHSPNNPNICDFCGKAFISPSLLKVHRGRHTGLKPFSCKLCGKGFATKFDLEVHLRFHTGERPYKVTIEIFLNKL